MYLKEFVYVAVFPLGPPEAVDQCQFDGLLASSRMSCLYSA